MGAGVRGELSSQLGGEVPGADEPGSWPVRPSQASGPRVLSGRRLAAGMRFCLVAGRFNEIVTQRLVDGAIAELVRMGASLDDVVVAWVPGALELPLAVSKVALSGRFDAVVCLGAVIRGETDHYEHVAGQCAAGVAKVQLDSGVPVTFGVLTTEDLGQAMERSGGKAGNKGADAAASAVEMADLLRLVGDKQE